MRSSLEQLSGERPKLLQRVLDNTGKFSCIVFAASLYYAWMIMGGLGPFAENTRISEHALMPGLVTERFDMDGRLSEYVKGMTELRSGGSTAQDYICDRFLSLGMECHDQQWRSKVAINNRTGRNVYGVVRANRATGVESMVIAVDLRDRDATSVVMAYAAFARNQVYWARDLFFVFVDGGAYGMDAFLSSYNLVSTSGIQGDPLPALGGLIIGAVVLKSQPISSKQSRGKGINIELNHLNGQLPNLDLFNSIVRIAGKGKFGLQSTIYGIGEFERIRRGMPAIVPLRALFVQAFTSLEGTHSVMGKYGVQGLTVAIPSSSNYPLAHSTRLLEAIARAMNNVLERFHQSYFLYILTTEDNFLSIAYYMPMMAVVLPLFMFAYREWVDMDSFNVPLSLPVLHLLGAVTLIGSSMHFKSSVDAKSCITWLTGVMAIPWGLATPISRGSLGTLRFMLYLEVAVISTIISFLNFGLGFISAVVAVPLILKLTSSTASPSRCLIRTGISILCHPLSIYVIFMVYGEPVLLQTGRNITVGIDMINSAVLRMVRDHLLFGSWLFPLLCLVALPVWNSMLLLAATPTPALLMPEEKQKTE